MGSILIVGSVLKLASACGVGLGASALMRFFHEYEFKTKKKGDKNDIIDSESLRSRAKGLY